MKKTVLHTQKSRLYLRFLKRPPTKAAKWITWVGLCLSKIALVAAASLKYKSRKKVTISLSDNKKHYVPNLAESILHYYYLVILKIQYYNIIIFSLLSFTTIIIEMNHCANFNIYCGKKETIVSLASLLRDDIL